MTTKIKSCHTNLANLKKKKEKNRDVSTKRYERNGFPLRKDQERYNILWIFLLVRSVNVHWWLLEVGSLECTVAQTNVPLINTASGCTTVETRIQEHPFSGFRLIGFLCILGEISLKVFLSVLNFLLLKKCKGFTNYDEIHNFERKLNLRHTTS